jgi:hypothetical protein
MLCPSEGHDWVQEENQRLFSGRSSSYAAPGRAQDASPQFMGCNPPESTDARSFRRSRAPAQSGKEGMRKLFRCECVRGTLLPRAKACGVPYSFDRKPTSQTIWAFRSPLEALRPSSRLRPAPTCGTCGTQTSGDQTTAADRMCDVGIGGERCRHAVHVNPSNWQVLVMGKWLSSCHQDHHPTRYTVPPIWDKLDLQPQRLVLTTGFLAHVETI